MHVLNHSIRLVIFLTIILLNTGYGQPPVFPELRITDVAYGTDPLQKMDITLLAGRTNRTPLVILIHGGGWMSGDKKDAGLFA